MSELSAKALREKRAPLANEIKQLADLANAENRDFTAEEQGKWDAINGEYNSLTRDIERAEIAERVTSEQEEVREMRQEERRGRSPGNDDVNHRESATEGRKETKNEVNEEHRSLALAAWMRAQFDIPLEARHHEACRLTGVRPSSMEYQARFRTDYTRVRKEYRALSGLTDTAGAYLIPEGFINNIEMAMLQFGGMRRFSEVMRTSTGENLPWPTSDDTSNKGVRLGENVAVSEQGITVGQVVFQAFDYSSKLIRVPRQLLRDSAFDLASFLGRALGERIGRITNDEFTTGTGTSQPKGIVTAATLGKTAASATAILADELIELEHSVDPSYREGNGVGWMMHDNVLLVIRKLKDGNGQYLWQPGLQAGAPDMLLNHPIAINQSMASSVTNSAKTVLFGDLSKYKIRDVEGFTLRRLVERYADQNQDGFLAFSAHDGNLLDAGTHPVKYLQQLA